jgi:NAD(P)-dependent dehydrogenase (short-subunit alcohol dehydrogenase family)
VSALSEKVAIVTGASRGIGRGIALALADQGGSVYVTGRTAMPGSHPLSGSIGETAKEVGWRGGQGIAVAVDHADDDQVEALFAQVKREQGHLDILVNNAFQLPETLTEPGSFWEKPLADYWRMVDVGVRSSYVAARHAAQIMVPQKSGLIVATSGYAGVSYAYGVVFGVCKVAVDRMAHDMAIELKPYNVGSLSLCLGLTFTERAERNLRKYPHLSSASTTNRANGTSVEFPGRLIAALAKDPNVMKRSGGTYIAVELAQEYGITDIDGKLPPSLRKERGAPLWSAV